VGLAQAWGSDAAIPRDLVGLTKVSGIGRKSANVIIRESGDSAEGIIVDLHVVRTAPRIGLAFGENPEKIEKSLMAFFPRERWGEVGMAFSFLGREICRPSYPKCPQCPVQPVCAYAKANPRAR
jgi:endonuclease-3